jgi:UMF1 family MFS transporter
MFGFRDSGAASRFAFLTVGIWWFVIGQIAIYYLREFPAKMSINTKILTNGFREMAGVFKQVREMPVIGGFLLAFFFLSTGVQTIILVAALFGSSELGIEGPKLIAAILIIQVVAIIGAWIFGKVSTRMGNKFSLLVMLAMWIFICLSAYFIHSETQFYFLAALVGLVMGGIQSQARSTFSKLMPATTTDTASFFSFYDITEKIAIVIGMFGFGFIQQVTGSMRNSTLLLSGFFIVSFILLSFNSLKAENR